MALSGVKNPNYKHGDSLTRLYRVWNHLRQRCNNPSDARFHDYGGRGIRVCKEWNEFINFKKWAISNGYKDNLTIERIDNDGNYCPENCRWATNIEQCNNRRSNRTITVDGITKNEKEWADFLGIPSYVLRTRLHRGMSEEDAIKTPVRTNINGKYVLINYYDLANKRLEEYKSQITLFGLGMERK